MYINGRYLLFIAVLFGILALMGCVGGIIGEPVPLQNQIALKDGGPHPGSWGGDHASFNYTYTKISNTLELSGDVSITGMRGGKRLNYFNLWMYFIDASGKVTEKVPLFFSSQKTSGTVNHKSILPTGINSIAFSYMGEESGHQTTYSFHKSPFL
jgi:hypothetical protein